MTAAQGNLIRKQFLVTASNIEKLEQLASDQGSSVTEVVRKAIDAYDPHGAETMEAPELMQLVSGRLKEAIASTKHANKVVAKALNTIGEK